MSNLTKNNSSLFVVAGSLFPPPSFMSFPRVAVSVAPGLLRFVSLRSTNIAEGIGVFESAPIPLTDLENFSEEARTGIKTVVSGFLEHKGHRHAVVVFPEEDVYLFRVFLPKMNRKAIRSAIELRIEENIPVSASDVVFEFDIIRETERGVLVAVSAVPHKSLDRIVSSVSDAGLIVVAAETEARCLARTFSNDGSSSSLIVFIGETSTVCVVASLGMALFSSTIPLSSALFRKAISETYSVPLEKADALRDSSIATGHVSDIAVIEKVNTQVKMLRDELGKIIEYWSVHAQAEGVPPVTKIIFSGSNASLPSFVQHVSVGFKIPVEIGDVWSSVAGGKDIIDIPKSESLDYAVLIGALIKR